MTKRRIIGQPAKVMRADGKFLRLAFDGEVVGKPHPWGDYFTDDPTTRYITITEGGGFDDTEVTHEFRIPGTRIQRIREGNAHVYAITDVEVPKVIAFEGPKDRGYTMRVSYLEQPGDALVELMKDGSVVREFLFPTYKIYNLQAHFTEIVDGEIAGNNEGYERAAWSGL